MTKQQANNLLRTQVPGGRLLVTGRIQQLPAPVVRSQPNLAVTIQKAAISAAIAAVQVNGGRQAKSGSGPRR